MKIVVSLLLALCLAASAGAKTKLTWAMYGVPQHAPTYERMIEAFEAMYPEFEVELLLIAFGDYNSKVMTMIASGQPPDVYLTWAQSRSDWIGKGMVMDITEYVQSSNLISLDMYYPQVVDCMMEDGRIWGTPWGFNSMLYVLNRDVLFESGMDVPPMSWTVQDFADVARKATNPIRPSFGTVNPMGSYVNNMQWIYNFGGYDWLDEARTKITLDQPAAEQAVQYWVDLVLGEKGLGIIFPRAGEAWKLFFARVDESGLAGVEEIPHPGQALSPCAVRFADGVALVYQRILGKEFSIAFQIRQAGSWSQPIFLSQADRSHRPTLTETPRGLMAAWEEERAGGRSVVTRELVDGQWGPMRSVGEEGIWQLFPNLAVAGKGRVWCAYLGDAPVMDPNRVMARRNSIHVCHYEEGRWAPMGRNPGSSLLVRLWEGLLPEKTYLGYHGLRRAPRLLAEEDGMWVGWEKQKREGDGVWQGDYLGVRFQNDGWGSPRRFSGEGTSYRAASPRRGRFLLAYKASPDVVSPDDRDIRVQEVEAGACPEVPEPDPGRWAHWRSWTGAQEETRRTSPDGYRLFWGDLHCHGIHSPDAEGVPDELLAYARDVSRLDFCAICENDYYPRKVLGAGEWRLLENMADWYTEERLVVFPGYEWTYYGPPGRRFMDHRIVIFPGRGGIPARRISPEGADAEMFTKFYRGRRVLCIPHHEQWELHGLEGERLVEVCSGWHNHLRSPLQSQAFRALVAGYPIGLVGNSDGHRFVPGHGGGLTGVWARELTREAIFEALWERRTIATTGQKVAVWLSVCGGRMGERVRALDPPEIRLEIESPSKIQMVTLYRGGEVVFTASPGRTRFSQVLIDSAAPVGQEHFYWVCVRVEGEDRELPHNIAPATGDMAYCTPVWVEL